MTSLNSAFYSKWYMHKIHEEENPPIPQSPGHLVEHFEHHWKQLSLTQLRTKSKWLCWFNYHPRESGQDQTCVPGPHWYFCPRAQFCSFKPFCLQSSHSRASQPTTPPSMQRQSSPALVTGADEVTGVSISESLHLGPYKQEMYTVLAFYSGYAVQFHDKRYWASI